MALFRVSNERAQFDAAGNDARDQYGAGIRFTQGGNARVTTGSPTNYNQGIPMSSTGQVAIVDATAGLPAGTIFHNGLPISGDKVCVSRNATAVVSNGMPYDAAGAVAGDINFDLNFIGTNTLNSAITFTRASSATFVGSNGLIQSATTNTPRFDYDPVTLAAKGLLIEEQRTNLLTYSEQFDNAAWVNNGGTVTANALVAPDGSTTADYLVRSTSSVDGRYQVITAGTSGVVTASAYIKKDTSPQSLIWLYDATAVAERIFATVTWSGSTPVVTATTGTAATPQDAGNGWWRIAITSTALTGANTNRLYLLPAYTAASNGQQTAFWGAQLEQGAFSTSYIPTVASQVTRSADVALINTLSPWFNSAQGTLYAEYSAATSNRYIFAIKGAAYTTDQILLWTNGAYTNPDGLLSNTNLAAKRAISYEVNNLSMSTNGGAVASDTSVTNGWSGAATAVLGASDSTGGSCMNGYIRRITYYPRRLSNAELQAITA